MENAMNSVNRFLQPLIALLMRINWEKFFQIVLVLVSPFLIFYNLDINPRTWHDEASMLSVPMTLVEDGVYESRNYGGNQTFGPIQSAGPTVMLSIAAVFKLFGVGLLQGRVIAGIYSLLALWFLYHCTAELFGKRAALLSIFIMPGSPAVGFLIHGRFVSGDIPALSFFLAACYTWAKSQRTSSIWKSILVGCLFGATMITKTQYFVMVIAAAILLAVLDYFYFRRGMVRPIGIIILTSAIWFFAWTAWQIWYFGADLYAENAQKFSDLAATTTGFSISTTVEALQFIFGSGSGYLFMYWGIFSAVYIFYLSFVKKDQNPVTCFLFIIQLLWIGFFVFWTIPWQTYFIVPGTILSMFAGKLASDLVHEIAHGWIAWKKAPDGTVGMLLAGNVIAVSAFLLFCAYQFQSLVRMDVLDTVGTPSGDIRKPMEYADPYSMVAFLNENIEQDAVIETWERELGILTDHIYHYPDQSMLVFTHASNFRNAPVNYSLGKEYFDGVRPDYVVVGWYSRFSNIYDAEFLSENTEFITRIGSQDYGYDIYKFGP